MQQEQRLLDGNTAAAEAMRLARVQVVATYPITPQSPLAESLADFVAKGTLEAKYLRVESEHSAMSICIGAALTGARAGTATSSVGLALMNEVIHMASGMRVPIVMPVVNRALAAPWSLWCDHQDSMSVRDAGWIQLYVETVQEVLDTVLQAYRIAEDPRVFTPLMICLDGFYLSHTSEAALVPAQEDVDAFVPPYRPLPHVNLDPAEPRFVNDLCPPTLFTEIRQDQQFGLDVARQVIAEVGAEFGRQFGRSYGLIEAENCEGADIVLVSMGTMAGTARFAAATAREQGVKVGTVRVRSFRPFPVAELQASLAGVPVVGVVDRSAGLGAAAGPLATEVRSCLNGQGQQVLGFVAGLGGRDVTPPTMTAVIERCREAAATGQAPLQSVWIDARPLEEVTAGD